MSNPYDQKKLGDPGTWSQDTLQRSDNQSRRIASRTLFPTSQQIIDRLGEHIVAQDPAKQVLANAVYNHYLLSAHATENHVDLDARHKNVLFVGPTGSGKTEMVRRLAAIVGAPFAYISATALTQAGYVGKDPEYIIELLLEAAKWNVDLAQLGVVFIDEVDKIAGKVDSQSLDVSGKGAQSSLLPFLDGAVLSVTHKGKRYDVDTKRLFIIAAGAFHGLRTVPGNDSDVEDVSVESLVNYGLMGEFVGRFSRIASLRSLTEEDLCQLLTQPRLLGTHNEFFSLHEVELQFTPKAKTAIARMAIQRGGGARGLPAIVCKLLKDVEPQLSDLRGKRVAVEVDRRSGDVRAIVKTVRNRGGCSTSPVRVDSPLNPTKAETLRRGIMLRLNGGKASQQKPNVSSVGLQTKTVIEKKPSVYTDISGLPTVTVGQIVENLQGELGLLGSSKEMWETWGRSAEVSDTQEIVNVLEELRDSYSPPVLLTDFLVQTRSSRCKNFAALLDYFKKLGIRHESGSPSHNPPQYWHHCVCECSTARSNPSWTKRLSSFSTRRAFLLMS